MGSSNLYKNFALPEVASDPAGKNRSATATGIGDVGPDNFDATLIDVHHFVHIPVTAVTALLRVNCLHAPNLKLIFQMP